MRPYPVALAFALLSSPAFGQQEAAEQPAGRTVAAEYATGIDYQQGDYFTGERVEIVTVSNVLRARAGRTLFTFSLPWHRIEAPGNLVGGGGLLGLPILVDPTRPATRETRQGLGDLRLGVGHTLPSVAGVELTLSGQVKLPTASARRGIGTGETDFAVGAEVARRFGAVTPFASIGYTMAGDTPDYDLQDSLSAQTGVALEIGRRLRANVSYAFAENPSPLAPDDQRISSGISTDLSRGLNLGVYGNVGLARGAPDVGAGVSLGFRLF